MTEKMICKHYGKYGHEEANCYEIVGYPASWGSRGRLRGGRRRRASRRGKITASEDHGFGCEIAHAIVSHPETTTCSSSAQSEQA